MKRPSDVCVKRTVELEQPQSHGGRKRRRGLASLRDSRDSPGQSHVTRHAFGFLPSSRSKCVPMATYPEQIHKSMSCHVITVDEVRFNANIRYNDIVTAT